MNLQRKAQRQGYYGAEDCDLAAFAELTSQNCATEAVPHAAAVEKNIAIYDAAHLTPAARVAMMAEWAWVLREGPGVLVLRGAYPNLGVIDAATAVFERIIAEEKAGKGAGADHFAAAGNNDRIWNSAQKLCLADPQVYVRYTANPVIDAVCEAWLGPNYQMTAQVNLVRPGGKAQTGHRDYHLGFQTAESAARYPAHVHHLSPYMTLQGGIAHCDMPIESGPTKLLPFSQLYEPGYAAMHLDEFRAHFESHCVQLPLEKGDAIFFNPALFHGAGENVSADIHRCVNLLQVSSAFGRAMESLDRAAMSKAVLKPLQSSGLGAEACAAAIAATAEGYAFPTNLDSDPPVGGLAPPSQAELLHQAVAEGWTQQRFDVALAEQAARRQP